MVFPDYMLATPGPKKKKSTALVLITVPKGKLWWASLGSHAYVGSITETIGMDESP